MKSTRVPFIGRFSVFLGLLTFILTSLLLSRTPTDADMWWHLRAGQVMWEQKSILRIDQFSYTRAGAPWVNAFWLAEIVLYWLYRLGGFFAISMFVAFMGGTTFWLIYRRIPGNDLLKSGIVLLAALTAAPIWSPRPQLFSFLLLALLDKILDEHCQGKFPKLWILIPLFMLWSNLHGGWIWGFLLLLAYIAARTLSALFMKEDRPSLEKWREIGALALWTILGALAIGLNPNGLAIWKLPFHTVDVSMQIQEWQSPDFHRIDFHPLLWMIFLIIIAGSVSNKTPSLATLFKLTGFAYLTFVSQRNIAPFAIIAAPILAMWMDAAIQQVLPPRLVERLSQSNQTLHPTITLVVNSSILLLLAMITITRMSWLSSSEKVHESYPTAAIEWIRSNQPEGHLFNSYNWGGYLVWALPEYPVFIDGRADLYGNNLISQWQVIVGGTDEGLTLLDNWHINLVLLERGQPFVKTLQEHGWKTTFQDEISVVLTR